MRAAALEVRATALVLATRILLRRHSTTETLRRLAPTALHASDTPPSAALKAVQRAGGALRAPCLPQSVALTALLARAGQRPALVLGCRRYDDGNWGAHAWVVVDGQVLEPVAAEAHTELARLDSAHRWVPTPPRAGDH